MPQQQGPESLHVHLSLNPLLPLEYTRKPTQRQSTETPKSHRENRRQKPHNPPDPPTPKTPNPKPTCKPEPLNPKLYTLIVTNTNILTRTLSPNIILNIGATILHSPAGSNSALAHVACDEHHKGCLMYYTVTLVIGE